MYIVEFIHEGVRYLLYNNGSFVGGTMEEAHNEVKMRPWMKIVVGNMGIKEIKDVDHLSELIGGVPYKIIDFFAHKKWQGVPMV